MVLRIDRGATGVVAIQGGAVEGLEQLAHVLPFRWIVSLPRLISLSFKAALRCFRARPWSP
jgi:hypothetical protein